MFYEQFGVHFGCGILKYGLSQVGLGGSALVKAWTNGGMDSWRGVQWNDGALAHDDVVQILESIVATWKVVVRL